MHRTAMQAANRSKGHRRRLKWQHHRFVLLLATQIASYKGWSQCVAGQQEERMGPLLTCPAGGCTRLASMIREGKEWRSVCLTCPLPGQRCRSCHSRGGGGGGVARSSCRDAAARRAGAAVVGRAGSAARSHHCGGASGRAAVLGRVGSEARSHRRGGASASVVVGRAGADGSGAGDHSEARGGSTGSGAGAAGGSGAEAEGGSGAEAEGGSGADAGACHAGGMPAPCCCPAPRHRRQPQVRSPGLCGCACRKGLGGQQRSNWSGTALIYRSGRAAR